MNKNILDIKQQLLTCDKNQSKSKRNQCLDAVLSHAQAIGTGEFSDAFLFPNHIVVKQNRTTSLHNPYSPNNTPEKFIPKAQEEMQGELTTFQRLKPTFGSILPEYMDSVMVGNRFFLLREYGEIPIDPTDKDHYFKNWLPQSVSQQEYDRFTKALYDMAETEGTFCDMTQPALHPTTKKLFLMDLGHFYPLSKIQQCAFEIAPSKPLTPSEQIDEAYRELERHLPNLDTQLGLTHKIPKQQVINELAYLKSRSMRRQEKQIHYLESLLNRSENEHTWGINAKDYEKRYKLEDEDNDE